MTDAIWDRIDASAGPAACWPWTGAVSSTGYGVVRVAGRVRGAHQVAYETRRGPVGAGLVVRHLCVERSARRIAGGPMRERLCCNPAHLELGTQSQNAQDRTRHGRSGRGTR